MKDFLTWLEERNNKILYVVRGISGSGKSTLAKQLAGSTGRVFATDDYFMQDGQYKFDASKLPEYHEQNLQRAIRAMQYGISPIVIDNTNTQAWEPKKYVEAALRFRYEVKIQEPNTPWAFNAEELARRNTHGVPRAAIDNMLSRWHPNLTVDDILKSKSPYERKI